VSKLAIDEGYVVVCEDLYLVGKII